MYIISPYYTAIQQEWRKYTSLPHLDNPPQSYHYFYFKLEPKIWNYCNFSTNILKSTLYKKKWKFMTGVEPMPSSTAQFSALGLYQVELCEHILPHSLDIYIHIARFPMPNIVHIPSSGQPLVNSNCIKKCLPFWSLVCGAHISQVWRKRTHFSLYMRGYDVQHFYICNIVILCINIHSVIRFCIFRRQGTAWFSNIFT